MASATFTICLRIPFGHARPYFLQKESPGLVQEAPTRRVDQLILDVPEEFEERPGNVVFLLLYDGPDRLPVLQHFNARNHGEVARIEQAQEKDVEQEN